MRHVLRLFLTSSVVAGLLISCSKWNLEPKSLKTSTEGSATNPTWKRLRDFPGIARSDAAVFVIGNKAYIAGGVTQPVDGALGDVWEFDGTTEQWQQKNNLPRRGGWASGFSYNNMGYLVGLSSGSVPAEILVYNPAGDQWTSRPEARLNRSFCQVCLLNNKAYIGVGPNQNTLIEYDLNTRASREIQVPQITGLLSPMMFPYNGKCYIGGGALIVNNSVVFSSNAYELDPSNATFPIKGLGLLPELGMGGGIMIGNRAFAITSSGSRLYEYKNGQWSLVNTTSNPPAAGGAIMFSIGNTLYYGLGYNVSDSSAPRSKEIWAITL